MIVAIYGDSLTSGENNNFVSYADKLREKGYTIKKIGVSGTTLGEYSIYPVEGFSLSSQLKYQEFKDADLVILEYGANDASSVCAGQNPMLPIISLCSDIDYIRQNRPDIPIIFLSLGSPEIIDRVAINHIDYLRTDYYKGVSKYFCLSAHAWSKAYLEVIDCARNLGCYICEVFAEGEAIKTLSEDNIHPSDYGYSLMSEKIDSFIKEVFFDEN